MTDAQMDWLLSSDEPWTRYRALVDLARLSDEDPEVQATRAAMVGHPWVEGLVADAVRWGDRPLKRHNDASHTIYCFGTLADFGLTADDPGMREGIDAVLDQQSPDGALQSLAQIPTRFGGTGEDTWAWMLCDAPTLLYSMIAMGLGKDPDVCQAADHLAAQVDENGWRCRASPELGRFRGPGRKDDPCPIANVYALKALSLVPDLVDSHATRAGTEMLLWHWEHQSERKLYLFGIGTDFRKIKYPFVWYDILHVMEVLSRFPFVYDDPRFRDMLGALTNQGDGEGRYTAKSMYRAWKGWSFADKKVPSPWLTFLVRRIESRVRERS